jgi:site-specific recombinase
VNVVDGIASCALDIGKGMRRGFSRAIDKTHQGRVCTQMYDIAENGEIGIVLFINSSDQAYGLISANGINEITAVKSVPAFDLLDGEMLHQFCLTTNHKKG